MRGLVVAVVAAWSSGCALGAGALTAAGRTALVENSGGDRGSVAVGAYAGVMPSASFTFVEGLASGSALSWSAQVGANLYVNGLGGTLEYQHRWDRVNWQGAFSGGSQLHGLMAYFSVSPGVVSFDVGAGALFGGKFALLGSCGTFLRDCEGGFVGDAWGPRFAARINLSMFGPSSFWGLLFGSTRDPKTGLVTVTSSEGPILPITSSLRLEVGYHRLTVNGPVELPKAVGALNLGVQLLLGFL
ncbi:MAG: hypothetical protein Q8L14_15905 [Myxococcales bacterium]|nr:hypothetical protein [Myxococcales bacterium]